MNSVGAPAIQSEYTTFSYPYGAMNVMPPFLIRILIANSCREGAESFKDCHRMGDGLIFSENLRASLFNDDLSNAPTFSQIKSRWTVPLRLVTENKSYIMQFSQNHLRNARVTLLQKTFPQKHGTP
jgi:hypothetical protein